MNQRLYTFELPDCADTVDEHLLIQMIRTLRAGECMTVRLEDDDAPIPYLPTKQEGPASAANADQAQSDSTPTHESTNRNDQERNAS